MNNGVEHFKLKILNLNTRASDQLKELIIIEIVIIYH